MLRQQAFKTHVKKGVHASRFETRTAAQDWAVDMLANRVKANDANGLDIVHI